MNCHETNIIAIKTIATPLFFYSKRIKCNKLFFIANLSVATKIFIAIVSYYHTFLLLKSMLIAMVNCVAITSVFATQRKVSSKLSTTGLLATPSDKIDCVVYVTIAMILGLLQRFYVVAIDPVPCSVSFPCAPAPGCSNNSLEN